MGTENIGKFDFTDFLVARIVRNLLSRKNTQGHFTSFRYDKRQIFENLLEIFKAMANMRRTEHWTFFVVLCEEFLCDFIKCFGPFFRHFAIMNFR